MLAEVKILIKGRTNADLVEKIGEEITQPTVTLIKDDGLVMVVDPGIMDNQKVLIDALKDNGLTVKDVDIVCITHSHLDHYRNVGMFPDAKVLEYYGLWERNTINNWSDHFSTNIQIVRTPGHDYSAITFFVNTKDGIVAICGDNFWKENYPKDPKDDPFASDHEKLKQSRSMILRMADWIIPGHAGMYKNDKNIVISDEELKVPKKKIEDTIICRKCKEKIDENDRCLCRANLCFRCCECGFDCPACGCSHKK